MKFTEVLEDYVIEEWASFYIEFLALKEQLNKIDPGPKEFTRARSSSFHWNNAHVLQIRNLPGVTSTNAEGSDGSTTHDDSPIRYPLLLKPTAKTHWEAQLKENIQRVESFFQHKKQEIEHFFNYFIDSLKKQKEAFKGARFFSELHEQSSVSAEQITLRYGNKKVMAEIYTELLCLESFCIVNTLCANILLKLYARKFDSEVTHESIQETFQLDKCEFTKTENFATFKDVIIDYVVKHVTHGNVQAAQDVLRKQKVLKMEDLARIAFFLGIVFSTMFVLVVAAWIEFNTLGPNLITIFFSSFQVYRFVFCTILTFWYITIGRYILQLKHLNFSFVLDIRPSNMGDLHEIIKLETHMTFFFLVAVILDIFFCSGLADSSSNTVAVPNIIGLVLFLSTVVFALMPLRSFLVDLKYAIGKIVMECLGAPFTTVAFIHILAADCLTSLNKVILDIVNSFCWVYEGGWREAGQNSDCNFSKLSTILILAFPYYLRFMQCLKRYYVTRLVFPNLYNAFKYSLSISTIILGNISFSEYPSLLTAFYVVGFSSFLYNNYWDNYNDWGLWRRWDNQKRFLRSRLTFSPRFYYTIMVLNFFLRLNSLATLLPKDVIQRIFEDPNLFLLLIEALEITRRFLWAIIRVEHELLTNFEKLRDFWTVPSVFYLNDKRRKKIHAL